MIKILELREKARTALGDQFDIREFHTAVLKNGALPLTFLEEQIDDYIRETLTASADTGGTCNNHGWPPVANLLPNQLQVMNRR